jgi:3-deoxy-D-manno-octulosonate 8-phosphate phosphatase (KDO 8-P phosphatase)
MKLDDRIRRVRFFVFDFDGVFTDNAVYVTQDGKESVRCSRSDGFGLRKLERLGIDILILSTEENPVAAVRSQKLKVPCIQGCSDKLSALRHLVGQKNLSFDNVAFMGNDINDLACLRAVGLPIVVADAHPDVLGAALWRTKHRGGEGAVREVCDRFEQVFQGE